MKYVALACFAVALLAAPLVNAETIQVKLPKLSSEAQTGGQIFMGSCAECHGMVAGGTDKGPPLIHKYYEPNHHGDFAFFRAVKQGIKAHHWPYGDMPPQPNVSEVDVELIIKFVREVQRENGIE